MGRRVGEEGAPRVPLRLNTLDATRKSMARLIRYRNDGKISDGDYRMLVWGMSQFLAYWRLQKDVEIEARLDRIESALDKQGGR